MAKITVKNIDQMRMYGQINEWTRISTFKKWIEDTIEP
jgi:hypothetical protein